ncbi:hypothetical protein E2C01_009237 [Portunus trituberculatus]|uniref:Uncharacterized protein n=1 Tax=Portunus trituberculatus TaxID=210409 RepID=A0A5B7D5D0_PORTR|nr:hypothetical protein [Portunus trituberculatus]
MMERGLDAEKIAEKGAGESVQKRGSGGSVRQKGTGKGSGAAKKRMSREAEAGIPCMQWAISAVGRLQGLVCKPQTDGAIPDDYKITLSV